MPRLELLLALGAIGCGARSVQSLVAPLEYFVTTTVTVEAGGTTQTQAVVHHCTMRTFMDSVVPHTAISIDGERHFAKLDDGSLFVMGSADPCRWFYADRMPAPGTPIVLSPDGVDDARQMTTTSYRFPDPAEPSIVEKLDTNALYGPGGPIRLSATLQVGGTAVTEELAKGFPWMVATRPDGTEPDRGFIGFRSTVVRLREGGACPAPDPEAAGPIVLTDPGDCLFTRVCRGQAGIPCHEPLGALRPSFDPGWTAVRYTLADLAPASKGTFVRETKLHAEGAPFDASGTWAVPACLDGECVSLDRFGGTWFYYPHDRVLVEISRDRADVTASQWIRRDAANEGPD